MQNRGVIAAAALCACLGVVLLGVIAQSVRPVNRDIASLTPGEYAACEGIVCETRRGGAGGEHLFVTLFDGSCVNVPFFNYMQLIQIGDFLHVEGTVSLYRGELEIIPEDYSVSPVLYGRCTDSCMHTTQGVFHTDLDDGFCAVIGKIENGNVVVERDLSFLLTSFGGRITIIEPCSASTFTYAFTLFGDSRLFYVGDPIAAGETSGAGIPHGNSVLVLCYEWREYAVESISEAAQKPEGYPVKVSGVIESIRISDGHLFLTLRDSTGCILVPVFKNMQIALHVDVNAISVGQHMTVVGTIEVYKGVKEVIPMIL